MARPTKIGADAPEWLEHASPEAQALSMQKRAANFIIPHVDFLILQELAAYENINSKNKITVSDIVRAAIEQGLEQINQRYDNLPNELAISNLEHQVAINALRNEL